MYITVQSRGPLLIWTINRQDRRHALGPTLAQDLANAIAGLRAQLQNTADGSQMPRMLAIMTTPTPGNIWISGGDLKELAKLPQPKDGRAYAASMAGVCRELQALPIPVAMAVDGQAIGGGLEFALAGDLRLATKSSVFDFRQLEIGLATAFGGAERLVKLVGLSLATKWQLLCAKVSADEAFAHGLVHEICADRRTLEKTLERWGAHFASLPAASVATQKRMLQNAYSPNAAQEELELFTGLWMNPHHKNFLEKFIKKSL